ncbi:peptidylprolyl isomerase fpr4 [Rhizophlyctis rosea]|nr:peptidylprolyl isomerase fpr4 [Rhizophlyctis rosea]
MFAGFWALKVEPTKTYRQIVDATFRISNASLAAQLPQNAKRTSITITSGDNEFTLCNLIPGHAESTPVDITFIEGEEVLISSVGNVPVDLTGNYVIDDEVFGDDDDEDDEGGFGALKGGVGKRCGGVGGGEGGEGGEGGSQGKGMWWWWCGGVVNSTPGVHVCCMIDELSSHASTYTSSLKYSERFMIPDMMKFGEDDEDEDLMDEDDEEGEWESGDEDDEEEPNEAEFAAELDALIGRKKAALPAIPAANDKKAKKAKIVELTTTETVVETPVANGSAQKKEAKKAEVKKETPKKEEKKESPATKKAESAKAVAKQQPKQETPKKETPKKETPKKEEKAEKANKHTLPGGLVVEDVEVGKGAKAKNGKKVSMRYIGRLTNGKVFDQNTKGKPFNFKLGAGEVIRGWDMGINGMNVGGSRKLTIPAALAYGSRGAPPDIPPNATLEFEVKLLDVKGK